MTNYEFVGMLGEATLRIANNETDDAIRMCLDVIRRVRLSKPSIAGYSFVKLEFL